MTFNEINVITLHPFIPAGIKIKPEENKEEVIYQAAHHQLIASAKAVKLAHQINPDMKVGMMIAYTACYALTCNPVDELKKMKDEGLIQTNKGIVTINR